MCRGGTGASARTTTTYFHLLPTSCYYYYLLPITYDNIHMKGAGAPLFFFARELPALSPRSIFRPLDGVTVERFSGAAVLQRCCVLWVICGALVSRCGGEVLESCR